MSLSSSDSSIYQPFVFSAYRQIGKRSLVTNSIVLAQALLHTRSVATAMPPRSVLHHECSREIWRSVFKLPETLQYWDRRRQYWDRIIEVLTLA